MSRAVPVLNGHALPEHNGGYLPFNYEITGLLGTKNILGVAVDSRWLNVPPDGYEKGPNQIDFLEPGGIVRSVGSALCRKSSSPIFSRNRSRFWTRTGASKWLAPLTPASFRINRCVSKWI